MRYFVFFVIVFYGTYAYSLPPSPPGRGVDTSAYNATTWDDSEKAPTQDAVRDKIEAISVAAGATIDDNAGNGDTSVTWSADKSYDELQLKQDVLSEGAFVDGDKTKLDALVGLNSLSPSANDVPYWNGSAWSDRPIFDDTVAFGEPNDNIYTWSIEQLNAAFQAYDANLPTWPATVDATEVGYLNGVTSAIQTQLDAKEDTLTNEAGLYSALSDVNDFVQPSEVDVEMLSDVDGEGTSGYVLTDDGDGTYSFQAGGAAEDTAYDYTTWDGDTDAASKNVIRDYLVNFDADGDGDYTDEAWFPSTSGAPTDASYITSSAEAGLSAETVLDDEAALYTLLSDVTDFVQPSEVDVEMLSDVTGEGTAATYSLFDDNDGTYSFRAIADGDIPDTITVSNYLPLAGGTVTDEIVLDENGIEFQETDTLTDCSSFATTGGGIFYDDSEGKFKKCQDNTLTDLDTSGSISVSDDESTNDDHEIVFTTDNTTLESDGDITYNPSTGVLTVTGGVDVPPGAAGPQVSLLKEDSDNGSNYVGIGSPASNNNDLIWLFPTADPSAGEVMSWAAPSSVTFKDGVARDATQGSFVDVWTEAENTAASYIDSTGVTYENLNTNGDVGTGSSQVAAGDHNHSGTYEPADATILKEADVDDTPVDAATTAPVSSNWAYDHENAADPHTGYLQESSFPETLCVAASDETTDLTTGTAKVTFRMPWALTLTSVRASVNTAPVGSTLDVDVNEGGSSVFSTIVTIDASEKTSTTAATAAVISDSSIADDAEMTIDIDQIGSSTAGKGLKVCLYGTRSI